MRIAPLAVALVGLPLCAAAQTRYLPLERAWSALPEGGFHFQKVNLKDDDDELAALVAKTAPSVVMISYDAPAAPSASPKPQHATGQEAASYNELYPLLYGTPADEPQSPAGGGRIVGSGVIVKVGRRVLIVTNAHVVASAGAAGSVDLTFNDGTTVSGKVLGFNERYDIGLIEPSAVCATCGPAKFADEGRLRRGHVVLAIGSPFEFSQSLSLGHVSYIGRDTVESMGETGGLVNDLIQTDAAVNPGSSGGALVDRNGELVGLTTEIYSPTGAFAGISFATPTRYVAKVLARYERSGVISPSVLGASVAEAPGAIIVLKDPGPATPAGRAGLKQGDAIVQIDGAPASARSYVQIVSDKVPGEKVRLSVLRANSPIVVFSDVASAHP